MPVQFKEKTYESYFLAELARRTNVLFSPDQVDEATLGFDGAFFLPLPEWRMVFPYRRFSRWQRLTGISASEIDQIGRELNDRLPPFRLNLFVQYKRPEWMTRSNALEWASWLRPYFRYAIDSNQQNTLENIARVAGQRAAVVYAAAAFRKSKELFAYAEKGEVVLKSNIASVELLNGHGRFTYVEPGAKGIAHSEPEPIESTTVDAMLRSMEKNEPLQFTKHLKQTAGHIKEATRKEDELDRLMDASRRAIVGGDFGDLYPRARGSWLEAILSIAAFEQAFDVGVSAVG